MSVFLTPDLTPVLGGTYYPPEDKHGRPGFKSVLLSVAKSVRHGLLSYFVILRTFILFVQT